MADPAVVVIGLDSITGLQSARLLAARGVAVVGVVANRRHWGARTNATIEVVQSPLHGQSLVQALQGIADRLGRVSLLLPCNDASVHTVSRARESLAGRFLIPLPQHSVVELLMDKVGFARHAAAVGLPVPRTETLASREDALRLAGRVGYPCLVKPATKSPGWTARTAVKAYTVRTPDELLSLYDRVGTWAPRLLVQEWVQGPESGLYSCNAYFDAEGRPLATFVARKVRQWPPYVGTSASGEECRNDEVRDTTVSLFSGLGYRGLAYLEMKRDARTGRLVIIEPNVGRPTGRSAIAEAGGVELLYTAYCDAAGLPLPAAREQRYLGAKWVDLRRDAQAAMVARRQGELSFSEWARWLHGPKAHAIWSRRDPKPFLVDLVQAAGTGGRRILGTSVVPDLQPTMPQGGRRVTS